MRPILAVLAIALALPAAAETVKAEFTHAFGDETSRTSARETCFANAKRLAFQRAGVSIKASTRVKDFELAGQDIESLVEGKGKVVEIGHRFRERGGAQEVSCQVSVEFDPKAVAEHPYYKPWSAGLPKAKTDVDAMEIVARMLDTRYYRSEDETPKFKAIMRSTGDKKVVDIEIYPAMSPFAAGVSVVWHDGEWVDPPRRAYPGADGRIGTPEVYFALGIKK